MKSEIEYIFLFLNNKTSKIILFINMTNKMRNKIQEASIRSGWLVVLFLNVFKLIYDYMNIKWKENVSI